MPGMSRFDHGGDIYTHQGVVDFSANINPLGMPERVCEALRQSVRDFEPYPDISCRALRDALSHAEGVPADQIMCTAGATDLMHRICMALNPCAALVTAPCFSGYEQALEQAGIPIVRHPLRSEDDFGLTDSILQNPLLSSDLAEPRQCDSDGHPIVGRACGTLLFLCNPNNPTGLTIERPLLVRILEAARNRGAVVVLDECFLDFTREASAVSLCGRFPNLVVMRAFTKLYAMAGLRLGYGICADAHLLERMREAGQLWAVSTPAQVAGVAALEEPGWAQRSREYVDAQRAILLDGLQALGMRVVPGQANYLLFQSPVELYEPLLQRGFLIRRCANYVGLDQSWYRIAVRTAQENAALLAALEEVCS